MRSVFPPAVFGLVAAAIALVAFALAQLRPGSGMVFVVAATTLWTAYVAHRARRMMQ